MPKKSASRPVGHKFSLRTASSRTSAESWSQEVHFETFEDLARAVVAAVEVVIDIYPYRTYDVDGNVCVRSVPCTRSGDGFVWSCDRGLGIAPVWVRVEAYSERGRTLNPQELFAYGRTIKESDRRRRQRARGRYYSFAGWVRPAGHHEDFRGHGPVEHVRKWRGGSGYFRDIHTTAEGRMNCLVIREEGEVPARACRQIRSLPNTRDDCSRCRERGWKAQSRGRKAWDR